MLQSRTSALAPELTFTPASTVISRLSRLFDLAIFLFFIAFTILLPFSIKGAQHAWKLAFLIWLAKLIVERKPPLAIPLSLAPPLVAYIALSALSTALSPDPILSWDRMKIVCLVLVGVLFAANLKSLAQVRILAVLLLLSGLAAAGLTAWQYTYGVGVQLQQVSPATPLHAKGIARRDILTRVNGQPVHDPAQLESILNQSAPTAPLEINYLRGFPFAKLKTTVTRQDFIGSGLGTNALPLIKGKPARAQGTLGHYIVFAEMLMQLACLAWALMLALGTAPNRRALLTLFAVIFIAITAALFATETRAALAGLVLGCLVSLLMLVGPRVRVLGIAALLLLAVAATAWIYQTRHVDWFDASDPGTNFRMLMWQDGIRLVRQHPWFGVGMETVRSHWQEWNIRGFALYHVISHFHSTFLQIAVERGLTTLAAWLWFVVAYLVFLFRLVRKAKVSSDAIAAGIAAGVLAAFVAFVTTSLVHYNLGEEPLVMILFFYFGLAVALDRMLSQRELNTD